MRTYINRVIGFVVLLMAGAGLYLFFRGEAALTGADAPVKRVVTDSAGREVELPTRPKRVVLLNASNLDLFYAAGGGAAVVGKPTSNALSDAVKEATASAKEVGVIHNPNVEAILGLKPDLVMGVNVPFHQSLIPVLEKAGIPMVIQSLNTYEEVIETLRFYGELTGDQSAAEKKIAKIEETYNLAIARHGDRPAPKNLTVWGSPESYSMATSKSFVGDLITRLGGNNIADQSGAEGGFVPLSMEYIAKADPEVIFLIAHSNDAKVGEKFQSDFAQNPVWKEVKAVKNQRVYILPSHLFAVNPGTRIGEALNILSEAMYPEGNG